MNPTKRTHKNAKDLMKQKMSEIIASEVCLVRCPKCENLIQEITDYSVYQCGGCGAVLRGIISLSIFYFSF